MVIKVARAEGNQRALVLDAECLRALDANETTEFEVTRNGNVIEVRPLPFDRPAHVKALAAAVMTAHDETFRKLSP